MARHARGGELDEAARRALAIIENVLGNFRGGPPPTKAQSDWQIETASRFLAAAADELRDALDGTSPDAGRGDAGTGEGG